MTTKSNTHIHTSSLLDPFQYYPTKYELVPEVVTYIHIFKPNFQRISFSSPSLTPMRVSNTAHLILRNSAFLIIFQVKYIYNAIHYAFSPHPLNASVCQV